MQPNETDVVLRDPEAESYLKLGRGMLRKWRHLGTSPQPPFIKFGTAVRYRKRDLDAFLDKHTRVPAAGAV